MLLWITFADQLDSRVTHFSRPIICVSGCGLGVKGSTIYMLLVAVWWLWCAKNKLCMENELVSLVSLKICTENYANPLINSLWQQQSGSRMRLIWWNDQGGTNMILNVDGSSLGNPDVSSFRELIRNSNGAWIHEFCWKYWFLQHSSCIIIGCVSRFSHGLGDRLFEVVVLFWLEASSKVNF